MKHVGIVAVSAPGAALCYTHICELAAKNNKKSPEISINAIPYQDYLAAIIKEDWKKIAEYVLLSIKKLKMIGAEFVVIPANTIHFAFKEIKKRSVLPIINLIDIASKQCRKMNFKKILVLGTFQTMNNHLYKKSLKKNGLVEVIPEPNLVKKVNSLIINQLIPGEINSRSVKAIIRSIQKIECDAIILACTELPIVLNHGNLKRPIIDTTRLIAEEAYFAARSNFYFRSYEKKLTSHELFLNKLSARERQVIELILNGKSLINIANELGLNFKTIGTYRIRIFNKLKVKNYVELAYLVSNFDRNN